MVGSVGFNSRLRTMSRPRATFRTGRNRRMDGPWARKAKKKRRAARINQKKRVKSVVKPDDWPTEMFVSKGHK